MAAVIDPPGTIRHTALDALIVGELDGAMSPRLLALRDAAAGAGFGFTASPHILVDLWSKFARLSVFSGMTALTRSPLGVLRADPGLMAMLEDAAREAIAVGRAHGVELEDGVMGEVLAMMRGMPPQAKSSMLSDLERGRPLELPWLSGAVVRLGAEKGVPTPTHRVRRHGASAVREGRHAGDGVTGLRPGRVTNLATNSMMLVTSSAPPTRPAIQLRRFAGAAFEAGPERRRSARPARPASGSDRHESERRQDEDQVVDAEQQRASGRRRASMLVSNRDRAEVRHGRRELHHRHRHAKDDRAAHASVAGGATGADDSFDDRRA